MVLYAIYHLKLEKVKGDLLSQLNSILKFFSIISLAVGLIVSLRGFMESYDACWASTGLAIGVSWLLFGIALLILGAWLASLVKK